MLNLENVAFRCWPREQRRKSCPNRVRRFDKHSEIPQRKPIFRETVNEVILGRASDHCVSVSPQLEHLDKMVTGVDLTNFITRCRTHAHLHSCKILQITLLMNEKSSLDMQCKQ